MEVSSLGSYLPIPLENEFSKILQTLVKNRPQSNMLKHLPKMLLEISQKFPLLCLDFFLLCSIMLTVIIAVRYVYTQGRIQGFQRGGAQSEIYMYTSYRVS